MLNLRYDFNNLMADRVGDHGIGEAELKSLVPKLEEAADAIEKAPLGFRKLLSNTKLADDITVMASEIQERCDNFVVVGIGGSALGNIALHSALNHLEYNHQVRPPGAARGCLFPTTSIRTESAPCSTRWTSTTRCSMSSPSRAAPRKQ